MSGDRLDYCRVLQALIQIKDGLQNFQKVINDLGGQYVQKVKGLDAAGIDQLAINRIYSPDFYKDTCDGVSDLSLIIDKALKKLSQDIVYYAELCQKQGGTSNGVR